MKSTFIKLHVAVLLAGFTGLFGKLVTLNEIPLSWWRTVLASLVMMAFLGYERKLRKVSARDFAKIGGAGVQIGLHWIFFYGSIKAANISVGVVCFSLVGFFSSILEPLINHSRFSWRELFFSLLTVLGIVLIFHFDVQYRWGIILGVISSAFNALYTISNRRVRLSTGHAPSTVFMYEMIGAAITISFIIPFFMFGDSPMRVMPTLPDFLWLLILSSACTCALYVLLIQVLKTLSAFTVNLTLNLEPIYSIIIAMTFFGEAKELTISFVIGLCLIFLSVALQTVSILRKR